MTQESFVDDYMAIEHFLREVFPASRIFIENGPKEPQEGDIRVRDTGTQPAAGESHMFYVDRIDYEVVYFSGIPTNESDGWRKGQESVAEFRRLRRMIAANLRLHLPLESGGRLILKDSTYGTIAHTETGNIARVGIISTELRRPRELPMHIKINETSVRTKEEAD